MKKKYSSGDLYKMSLGQLKAKYDADLNSDGTVDQTDVSLSKNSVNEPVMAEDKLKKLMSLSGGALSDNDSLYTYYRNKYVDGASLAAENAYGLASSHTGGYGSTYASSAAAGAYEKYMAGLYDKLEDVNEKAYKNAVGFAGDAAKYGDYSYYEAFGADMSAAKRADAFEQAVSEAKYGDYSGLDYMDVDTSLLRNKELLGLASEMAKYGDYSGLERLGVDTTQLRYSELLEFASEMAKYGDYSGLEALGVNTESLKEEAALEKALSLAKYGDFSLLGGFSSNLSALKSKIGFTVQKGAEAAYLNAGYSGLINYLNRQMNYGQINSQEKQRIITAVTGG